MKDCGLLIYVPDANEQTPSSYCGIADMLYSGGEQLSNCSTVDGLSADILQVSQKLAALALLATLFVSVWCMWKTGYSGAGMSSARADYRSSLSR